MITKERLDELFLCDPEAGTFTRRVSRGNTKRGSVAGHIGDDGYLMIRIDGKLYRAHRLVFLTMTGEFPPTDVDHINGIRTDNRWSNLRLATRSQNLRNKSIQSNNTSGALGVSWDKRRKKWEYRIKAEGVQHIGVFAEFEDAVAARKAAEIKYFGEFAPSLCRA